MANWTFEGVIFKKSDDPNYETEVDLLAPDAICGPDGRYYLYYFTSKMDKLRVADAITEVFSLFKRCNKYIDETMPWALAKDESKQDRLATVLYNLV